LGGLLELNTRPCAFWGLTRCGVSGGAWLRAAAWKTQLRSLLFAHCHQ